jgi:hypothetical protein
VRVVVAATGAVVSLSRARRLGIEPDVIFVRADGWTLGAPWRFAPVAVHLWLDDWIEQWERVGGAWRRTWATDATQSTIEP